MILHLSRFGSRCVLGTVGLCQTCLCTLTLYTITLYYGVVHVTLSTLSHCRIISSFSAFLLVFLYYVPVGVTGTRGAGLQLVQAYYGHREPTGVFDLLTTVLRGAGGQS